MPDRLVDISDSMTDRRLCPQAIMGGSQCLKSCHPPEEAFRSFVSIRAVHLIIKLQSVC